MTITLTPAQHKLLCECIRYRAADNDQERADAARHGLSTAYYDRLKSSLDNLKNIIYNI